MLATWGNVFEGAEWNLPYKVFSNSPVDPINFAMAILEIRHGAFQGKTMHASQERAGRSQSHVAVGFFFWEPNRENRSGVILKVAFGIESQVVDSGFEYHVAPKLIIMVISFD